MAKKTEVKKDEKIKAVKEDKTSSSKAKATKAKAKKKKEKKGNIFSRFWRYLKDVRTEMGKVRWPNKKEMLLYSGATLGFIIIFALFFMLNDVVISAFKQLVR